MRQTKPAPRHRNQKTVDDLELYPRFHKRGEPSGESNQIEYPKELFSKIWAGRHFSPLDPALVGVESPLPRCHCVFLLSGCWSVAARGPITSWLVSKHGTISKDRCWMWSDIRIL
ncbi:uncharacterized protein CCOS01_15388 [Colletotrichum costaricense]|uniref:Uncharacterized protein n=2 Tax=Colletotrichum acutatum species complex TaxID=2707335 RepID=A0AAI9YIH7_9PEZI|nr:uncharacterized protein CCOS01_15388 [Colletotrichum costaricense]KAK1510557.1 hypothetical protein CCOS01_15388 [Colletotrichum costaricense]